LRHSPRLPPSWSIGALGEDISVVNAIDRTGEVYQLPLAIGDHHLQLPIGLSGAARRVTKSAGCAHIQRDDSSTGTTDHPDLEKGAVRRPRMGRDRRLIACRSCERPITRTDTDFSRGPQTINNASPSPRQIGRSARKDPHGKPSS